MIILVRHGEAEKAEGRAIGQTDLPLSENGRKQATLLAEYLSNVPFEHLYTSPLLRTRETAAKIEKTCTPKAVLCPEFAEINLGDWDGISFKQIKNEFPNEYIKRGQDLANYRPPNGESFTDLKKRVQSGLKKIIDLDSPVVIVTHAGVIRIMLHIALEFPLNNIFKISPLHCNITVLKINPAGLTLENFNIPPDRTPRPA
ncbi:probable phosphoglycerate mutase [Maridesulfovibrio ferrireducens]|uniref:Probable phosphoglycerate mutase n=1 Tax=Maridesulfovibrio ferrireducens TaxID=246191 RepID=A0A1G9BDB1_9BACT|nr:histidine phosphatase family protein [Maridesulfovibrio ferrireducens]SDK37459.1 probable phosphoglycerate mutase [Maridesulfovibrio ferrireducens]